MNHTTSFKNKKNKKPKTSCDIFFGMFPVTRNICPQMKLKTSNETVNRRFPYIPQLKNKHQTMNSKALKRCSQLLNDMWLFWVKELLSSRVIFHLCSIIHHLLSHLLCDSNLIEAGCCSQEAKIRTLLNHKVQEHLCGVRFFPKLRIRLGHLIIKSEMRRKKTQ